MERRDFLKNSCYACMAAIALGSLFTIESCSTPGAVYTARIRKGRIVIPLKAFGDGQTLLVQTIAYREPILVIRKSPGEAKALLMRCSHRGEVLEQRQGQLVCKAHGSVFDLDGNVLLNPASRPLTSFRAILDSRNCIVIIES